MADLRSAYLREQKEDSTKQTTPRHNSRKDNQSESLPLFYTVDSLDCFRDVTE